MPTSKKPTTKSNTKSRKRAAAPPASATSHRKPSTVLIDGVQIELRPVKGKGALKRADIVRAVKKVISARVRTEAVGGVDASDE